MQHNVDMVTTATLDKVVKIARSNHIQLFIILAGIEKPVYFFNHNQLESSDEQLMSKSNLFEAKMVVGLTR